MHVSEFKKRGPFPIRRRNVEIGQSSMTLHAMSDTLIVISRSNHLNVCKILPSDEFVMDV